MSSFKFVYLSERKEEKWGYGGGLNFNHPDRPDIQGNRFTPCPVFPSKHFCGLWQVFQTHDLMDLVDHGLPSIEFRNMTS